MRIHPIQELFQERCEDGFGLLLMDAANAFGSLSRSAAYGMQECYGQDVPDFFSTHIEDMHF